jgi:hypothetical protein
VAAVGLLTLGIARGPVPTGSEASTLRQVLAAAGPTPVLAEGQLAEQVADAGGQVWISNPLDAFTRFEQRRYVAWMETGDPRLIPEQVRVVLVLRDGDAAHQLRRAQQFRLIATDAHAAAFVRG